MCAGHGCFPVERERGHVPQMRRSGDSAMVLSLVALPSTHRQQLPHLGTAEWSTGHANSLMPLWSVQRGWTAVRVTSVGLQQHIVPFWHRRVLSAHLVASILNLTISVFLSMEHVSGIIHVAPGGGSVWVATTVALLTSITSLCMDLSHSVPCHHLGGWSLNLPASVLLEMASAIGIVSSLPTCKPETN